jgi:hypothetical protein
LFELCEEREMLCRVVRWRIVEEPFNVRMQRLLFLPVLFRP